MLDGHKMQISASLGISLYPHDGGGPDILMKNADVAMYHAKEQGRNNFQYFDAAMNTAAFEKMMLEIALRGALEREELVVHYQPQINMKSWQIVGVEALVRWQHPVLGLITPDQFIPLAEETGLIIPLGKWVLQNVCAQIKAWQGAGYPTLRVTVNLSPRQFQQHDLVEMITAAIHGAGLDPALVELEITESVAMENIKGTVEKLKKLSDLGISFSIDDFGTGYSSLSYLKKLPIQTLKIDKSFMQDVTTNYDDAMIVSAVILMAHSLNLKVIAEGVESTEQLDFLLDRQCNEMQGYLFSRPLSADKFAQLFSDNPTYADSFQSIASERARKRALGNC
jgi:EAL domain-containing protein (putative c-di-GMP-specific phosphodiesterase class I)